MNPQTHVSNEWMEEASCVGADPNAFFPEEFHEPTSRTARKVCRECPVIRECLSYALRNYIREGMFGGVKPSVRRKLQWRYSKVLQETDPIRLERAFELLLDDGIAMSGRH
jgi:WhiB family redox-sensing transcriptional regulator